MNFDGNELVTATMHWLQSEQPVIAQPLFLEHLTEFDAGDLEQLLSVIEANWSAEQPYHRQRLQICLQQLAACVLQRRLASVDESWDSPAIQPELVLRIYNRICSENLDATGHCLQILAGQGDEQSLRALALALADSPPESWETTALAISPLFQYPPDCLPEFFDQLGSSAFNAAVIGPLLDLANYATRRGILNVHPLTDNAQQLASLLGRFVERLSKMEDDPQAFSDNIQEIQKILSDSISIAVSLCDALGLIGDESSQGKLNRALALAHRRIQTEAAGALARMGNEEGKQRLLELVLEPVARLRAIAYAEELGFEHEISEELRSPLSIAEAEMASWLSECNHFGFPPNELQLVDQRTQFWPSYEEPQACYLWRYTYCLPTVNFSNIGISGPVTHAFRANLADMSLDDIYAVYAGWQGQHEDIFEIAATDLNAAQKSEVVRLEKSLAQKQVEDIETLALTFFFGERAILAVGRRFGRKICAVIDSLETILFPVDPTPSSLTPELVLAIYRGRKMLRTFNSSREED